MADSSAQDKNLPATQRKLDKAREDGQLPRSRDLGHFAAIGTGAALLLAGMPLVMGWTQQLLARSLRFDASALTGSDVMFRQLSELTLKLLMLVVPVGLFITVVTVAAGLLIGGWNWTWKPLMPKFDKLNPITGITRIFSKHQAVDALKASLLALILGTIGALYLNGHVDAFSGAMAMSLPSAMASVGSTMVGGIVLLLIALALFAAVDAPWQMQQFAKRMRMSHHDIKQEHKESEGNGEIKAKMKVRMREMTRRRMMAAVPDADLVVMNPTHYAVALKYDETKMGAPRVVAKGADLIALAIRDLAKTSKVPVLQSPVLARALYAHAEIDREIPAALFAAVAQVLAYVYQLRAALNGKAPMPGDVPAVEVPRELDPHNKAAPVG